MAGEELKALVRRELEEIFGRGRLDVADEIVAPDYVGYDPALPEPARGPEGLKQWAAGYRAAFPDLAVTVEEQVAEGDTVVTRWTARGTHQGELFGIAPTGKEMTVTGMSLERIADGRIVEDWTSWDALGLLVQLGAVEMPTASPV